MVVLLINIKKYIMEEEKQILEVTPEATEEVVAAVEVETPVTEEVPTEESAEQTEEAPEMPPANE